MRCQHVSQCLPLTQTSGPHQVSTGDCGRPRNALRAVHQDTAPSLQRSCNELEGQVEEKEDVDFGVVRDVQTLVNKVTRVQRRASLRSSEVEDVSDAMGLQAR